MSSSTKRSKRGGWVDAAKLPRGPNGRALCRQCGTETKPPKQTFCSDDCVSAWRIRTSPAYARQKVFERDLGVCAICEIDTIAASGYRVRRSLKGVPLVGSTGHLWQADHIRPVIEGGGECGLDNLRTLCTECHKAETAKLAKRLARRRREAKPLPLLDDGATA